MAEQKQDSRSRGSGGKKKQDQPHSVRMGEAAKVAAVRKHRLNVQRHLVWDARRAGKQMNTPRGEARRMRRERLRRQDILFQGWRQPKKQEEAGL